jgi:hypothetical protein
LFCPCSLCGCDHVQDAERHHRQVRVSADTGAVMEAIRRQRELLVLWHHTLHSLQVCSAAAAACGVRLL